MRQLLQQGPDSIGASIGELGYRSEMDIYSSRMSGADAVEAALFHNLDNDLSEVMRFCQGQLKSLVAIYVERFAFEKAKTVLRAINGGASDEVIENQILPSENPRNSEWIQIIKSTETLQEAVNAMAGTHWGRILSKLDSEASLEELEDALDQHYYSDALKAMRGRDANPLMLRYLRTEIDHRNIINLFRELRQNVSLEKRYASMISGGRISDSIYRQASQADSMDSLLDALRRSNAFDDDGFEDAIRESKERNTLDSIATLLSHQRRSLLRKFSYLNPVSAFPVIYYIESKVLEIQNLRLLVRAKSVKMPDKLIEAHMEF
jgi:vacuolar-type H+-ATPase subunit C/Vma6